MYEEDPWKLMVLLGTDINYVKYISIAWLCQQGFILMSVR